LASNAASLARPASVWYFALPLGIGHAVDDLARLVLVERDARLVGRVAIPVGQAVAAEAGEVHQVDVLHVGALAQMLDERAEGGRLEVAPLVSAEIGHRLLLPAAIRSAPCANHTAVTDVHIGQPVDRFKDRASRSPIPIDAALPRRSGPADSRSAHGHSR
jgi:hypothetical protein